LELAFHTKSIRTVCESGDEAKRELGAEVAAALRNRLADMRAAKSPKDLVVGQPRIGADSQHMIVDLCDGHRIVFKANHANYPKNESNELDWARVSRIKIMRIESEDAS
jgi:plasmid maintenance system killer protein